MSIVNSLGFSLEDDWDKVPFNLLLLADPSIERIKEYLETGDCIIAYFEGKEVGVIVANKISSGLSEIKNIAVSPDYQGQGVGKALLKKVIKHSEFSGYEKMRVCTGNSSLGPLALYQKMGFEIVAINFNYFLENYEEPIFENGIQCKHQIVLEKVLL